MRGELTRLLINRDNELFSQGVQRFFLAYEDDKPVARVLAGIDTRRNAQVGEAQGYFSLFETYENMDYARAVLDAATAILKEHGVPRLTGPVAPSYDMLNRGLLVEGFDGPPVLYNPYNPPYYADYLTAYGFTKERDYLAYLIRTDEAVIDRIEPIAERAQKRFGFRVRPIDLNKQNLTRLARDIATVISDAMPEEPGAYLPTPEDIATLLNRVRPFFRSEIAWMAYAGNRPIGLVIGLLDYNRVLKRLRGSNTPWGWLMGRLALDRIDTVRCPMQYVVPEFQNKAVNAVLVYHAVLGAKQLGIRYIEGSTVDETHSVSINNSLITGGEQYRVYRNYQKTL
ncbi:MAG: hypothetical protein GX810_09840 [Clostridiales bacterium]|nr:hypothetical protein [Clostridiales bacterium]